MKTQPFLKKAEMKTATINIPNIEEISTTIRMIERQLNWNGGPITFEFVTPGKMYHKDDNDIAEAWYEIKLIKFNLAKWQNLSEQSKTATICHEVCHIVDYWRNFHDKGFKDKYNIKNHHKQSWRLLMYKLGFKKVTQYT
jgi:predicted SprT family Zn-dependent metalloprotease